MSDKFGWTSDKWDEISPEARGNLIANLEFWESQRQKERAEAIKKQEKMRKKYGK